MEAYQMKPSGVEWLGDVPEHWGVDRIKDVARLRTEKTAAKSEKQDYLELEDISQWTGKVLNKRNTLEVESQVNVFYKDDVLFGKLRPYLAKCVCASFDGKCTGEILAIKPIKSKGSFLAYYMRSKYFINHCNNFAYGAKMPRVNWITQLGVFPMPIPSIKEQQAIADYLDQACNTIDQTIEVKKKQLEKLAAYRKSVIHEAVTKGLDKDVPMKPSGVEWLGEVNKAWSVVKLKRVLAEKLKYGANEAAELDNPCLPRYIRITDFGHDGKLRNNTFKSLEESVAEPYLLSDGDVLFARSGATVGKTFQFKNYEGKACFAGYLIKATVAKHKMTSDFLYYYTKSKAYENWKDIIFTQATIQNIGADKYQYLNITVPPIADQFEITAYLDQACNTIDQSKQVIEKQVAKLTEYRKSLIHECVTGKKRVYQGEV